MDCEDPDMSKNFFVRNSLYVTLVLAAGVMVYTVANWNTMPVTQRIAGLYFFLIALHEIEEMKVPGGFVEMGSVKLTGMPIKDMTVPHFLPVPDHGVHAADPVLAWPSIHWLVIGPLVLGTIRTDCPPRGRQGQPRPRGYSLGMVTAVLFDWSPWTCIPSTTRSPSSR